MARNFTNPKITLPNAAIRLFDKISALDAFVKDLAFLGDIRVDPHANLN